MISPTDLVGWASTTTLLATLIRQVYSQWRSGTVVGVSRWLFVGQCAASLGYLVYSALVGNAVFVASNALILGYRNSRRMGAPRFEETSTRGVGGGIIVTRARR